MATNSLALFLGFFMYFIEIFMTFRGGMGGILSAYKIDT